MWMTGRARAAASTWWISAPSRRHRRHRLRGDYGILADPLATTMANTERQRLLGWLDALDDAGITPTVIRLPHGDSQETATRGHLFS